MPCLHQSISTQMSGFMTALIRCRGTRSFVCGSLSAKPRELFVELKKILDPLVDRYDEASSLVADSHWSRVEQLSGQILRLPIMRIGMFLIFVSIAFIGCRRGNNVVEHKQNALALQKRIDAVETPPIPLRVNARSSRRRP